MVEAWSRALERAEAPSGDFFYRSIQNGSNRKEASLARKRRNNIPKGGTCKSGIEPRKAREAPVIIEAGKSQDLEGELASWRPRKMNFFSVSIILKRKN